MLPAIAAEGLADAVDAFCEGIAFSPDEVARLFDAAARHGLPIRLHAEQLSNLHGATLAARRGALSADHLEYADENDAAAMAAAGTVAVLLPGAYYFLRETHSAAGRAFPPSRRAHRACHRLQPRHVAADLSAADHEHGRHTVSPDRSGMHRAVTREAARALGRLADIGTLEAGKRCDLAIWNVEDLDGTGLPHRLQSAAPARLWRRARRCRKKEDVMSRLDNIRVVRAARGTELSAKSWLTEAPLRMLMNNLDPEVAERPGELVVYGGMGRAARDWQSFDQIVAALRRLEGDQTLLVQSGKPVGIFRTHADAPRVLIANSNIVPAWATWEHFHELDRKGLMMYGQMTAGSWIYIGSQGIVQGTYETFVEVGRQHYGGDLAGRWLLTAGLGGMGGAQPLAAVMAGLSCLAVECQASRIDMRLRTGYLDRQANDLDEALALMAAGPPRPQADVGRPARQCRRNLSGTGAARRQARRRHRPDLGARSAQRLSPRGVDRGGLGGAA